MTTNSKKIVSAGLSAANTNVTLRTGVNGNAEQTAIVKAERTAVATQFAETTLLKNFFAALESAKTDDKKSLICRTNVSFQTDYRSSGLNFVSIPSYSRFSEMLDATDENLAKLKDMKEFKGNQLLVYTSKKGGHIVGSIDKVENIEQAFAEYRKINTIDVKTRFVKTSKLSLSEAFRLASEKQLKTLLQF